MTRLTRLVSVAVLLGGSAPIPAVGHDLVISEFMAVNGTTLLDEDSDSSDWIEIHHQGFETIDLDSHYLTDDSEDLSKWRFPPVSIEGGGYLLIFASGKDRRVAGSELHTNFRLGARGEYLALVAPDGATVLFEYAPTYPKQRPDLSYGIGRNVLVDALVPAIGPCRVLVPDDDSLGSSWTGGVEPFDDTSWTSGTTGVGYSSAEPGFAVRTIISVSGVCSLQAADDVVSNPAAHAEVYSATADVIDFFNTGGSGHYGNDNAFPGLDVGVDVNNYVVEAVATVTIPEAGNWTFGVNSDDGFRLDVVGHGRSFTIEHAAPRGPGDTLGVMDVGEPGDYDLHLLFYECGGGSEVEIFAAPGSHTAWNSTFRLLGDTPAGGLTVYSDVGEFGTTSGFRSLIGTEVETEMRGSHPSAYVRIPFDVVDPGIYESLTLRVKYDDGFIAYLNGVEIARQNAPASARFDSRATADRPREQISSFQQIDVTDHLGLLRIGANVLAVHGLNDSVDSDDFLILAELAEITFESMAAGFFATSTPGGTNANELLQFVADTTFSVDRGFYEAPFDVTIATATPGAEIRYTTDGSEPTLENGLTYTAPLRIDRTTVLRAAAFKEGLEPTNVDTHTYIFLADVLTQTGAGFPATWGSVSADYDMDPEVVNDPRYAGSIRDDLRSVPTISIVMREEDLFGSGRGIYSNSEQSGIAWERPGSVEVIVPEEAQIPGGGDGVQVDCGVRMHGGVGRRPDVLKHSFRFLFKGRYGATKLNYPLFGSAIQLRGGRATEQFDTVILRAGFNNSWVFGNGSPAQYLRDQFIRDTLLDMGQPNGHGSFVHLYLNGLYWGLYNLVERPNAPFAASYMGGSKEDWDILNSSEVIDGSKDAWNTAQSIASAGVSTDAQYRELQEYVDVPNLIDYMLVNFYGGNADWDGHNWYSGRLREPGAGYKFFSWDAERTLEGTTGSNRTGLAGGDKPSGIYSALRANADFRLLFADHAHRHCFNGGELTPTKTASRYQKRADEVFGAIVGESARWGDKGRGTPYTRDVEWVRERDRLLSDYFPRRTDVLISFLRAAGLYPDVEAPSFNRHGGGVDPGFDLVMFAPLGTIYYTVDGTDPRLPGGGVSPSALIARSGSGSAPTRTLIPSAAEVRILVPQQGDLGLDWTAPDFDDSGWSAGLTGVGYERGSGYEALLATDVETEMYGLTASVYLRVPFAVDDPAELVLLTLRMKYDDGFVAYLNGTRVAFRNAPSTPEWNSTASGNHDDSASVVFEDMELENGAALLRSGTNVLAIHGLNTSTTSSDLLILPELRGTEPGGEDPHEEGVAIPIDRTTLVSARVFDGGLGEWSALNRATFAVGTSDFRITEIMYNPPANLVPGPYENDDFEFIEFQYIGQATVNPAGVRLVSGVEFTFTGSHDPADDLRPGEIVLIVRNLEAFRARYPGNGLNIAGEYRGSLGNGGESLVVEDGAGRTLLDFAYSDLWYPQTDGEGLSLEIRDASAPLDTWGERGSWRPSGSLLGTPGEAEFVDGGLQRHGDINQDGILDISDAIGLLLHLFAGRPETLPCDGGTVVDAGNRALLDVNGDSSVNLSDSVSILQYLFTSGSPPTRGTGCVFIESCPQACAR